MRAVFIFVIAGAVFLGGTIIFVSAKDSSDFGDAANSGDLQSGSQSANVTVVDGKQIVEINAKGGYEPRKSVVRAGIPTVIRFDTNGTFDCSASVRIPSMNISKNLPLSGITDIDVGTQPISTLNGTCGMGMYRFEVEFN